MGFVCISTFGFEDGVWDLFVLVPLVLRMGCGICLYQYLWFLGWGMGFVCISTFGFEDGVWDLFETLPLVLRMGCGICLKHCLWF